MSPSLTSHHTHTHTRPYHLLWDGERCDLGRVGIVLAVEGGVHGELAPEHQLSFPSVACRQGTRKERRAVATIQIPTTCTGTHKYQQLPPTTLSALLKPPLSPMTHAHTYSHLLRQLRWKATSNTSAFSHFQVNKLHTCSIAVCTFCLFIMFTGKQYENNLCR